MKGIGLLNTEYWSLEKIVGNSNSFWRINSQIVTHTWIILFFLLCTLLFVRFFFLNTKTGKYITISFLQFFIGLTKQAIGTFVFNHFAFVISIFIFIVACNISSIIPWIEEPTRDLNTTLALGIISFIYTQIVGIRAHGIISYIKGYFSPIFFMFPLNVVGKISTIISISFRLFGNIFGGSIISGMYFGMIKDIWWAETIAYLSTANFGIMLYFTLFEGVLQAFVFSILSLTYISLSLQEDGH